MSKLLICDRCNQEVMEGTIYCTRCGKELDPTKSTISCPKCSARISFRARFCSSCGTNVFSLKRSPIDPYGNYRILAPVKYDDEKTAKEKRDKAIKYQVAGDYNNAFNLFLNACSHDDAIAEFYVGFYYLECLHVERDYDKAIKYFTRSADKGDNYSMYMLGEIYKHGLGIAVNKEIAKTWYKKACNYYMPNEIYFAAKDALKKIDHTRIIKQREFHSQLTQDERDDFYENATYVEALKAQKKLEKSVEELHEMLRTSNELPHFLKEITNTLDLDYSILRSSLLLLYGNTGRKRFPSERFPEFEMHEMHEMQLGSDLHN